MLNATNAKLDFVSVDNEVKKVGGILAKKVATGMAGALIGGAVDAAMESLV